jgi:WD40 repeat protein
MTISGGNYQYVVITSSGDYRSSGSSSGTGQVDDAICIWDAHSGKRLKALFGSDVVADYACWSPDGRWIATITNHGRVQIWGAHDLNPVQTLQTDSDSIHAVAFTPDGSRLLALHGDSFDGDHQLLSDSKQVSLWDVESGKKVGTLVGHTASVLGAVVNHDGTRIASVSEDGTARVWDATTGVSLLRLTHANTVRAAAFSPDGKWIVTASDDTTARIWYADTGQHWLTISGYGGPVYAAAFSVDSRSVLTGSGDGRVRLTVVDPLPAAMSRSHRELTAEEVQRFGLGNKEDNKD